MTKHSLLLGAAFASATLFATPTFAQDNDEVIVTATKRATTLQDTPISVSVTGAEVIEQAQILDILALQSVVPTFRVSQLQNTANATLTIRGFGNGGNNLGIEPAVGLFIDGVYRSRAGAQIADLPALERVEVLGGPQTTLFGKNASVGVVSIVTEAPQFDTQGYVEAGYGNFNSFFGRGYLTGAISDTLAVSLGGGFQQRDGLFDPLEGTAGGEFNNRDRFNLRAQALWQPTDDLSVRLIADRSELDENCCGTTTAVNGAVTSPIVNALGGQLASIEPGQAPGVNPDPFSQETALNAGNPNSIDDEGISAQIDYTWGDLTFTSITAYRTNDSSFTSDSDFTSLDILEDVFQSAEIDTFTQEFRIASNYDGRFNWQLGGTYFDETLDVDSGIDFGEDARPFIEALAIGAGDPVALGTALATGTLPQVIAAGSPFPALEFVTGNPIGSFFSADTRVVERFEQDNDSFSIFGTVDFDVTDKFTVSLGGNYTEDNKDVFFSQQNDDVFSQLALQGADGFAILNANGVPETLNPFIDLNLLDSEDPASALTPAFEAFFAANPLAIGALDPNLVGAPQAFIDGALAATRAQIGGGLETVAGLLPLQNTPQTIGLPNSVEDGSTTDDDFTWSVRGNYEVNDNFNVYASAATGFKASSFNLTRASAPFIADAPAIVAEGLNTPETNAIAETGRNFGTRFAEPEEITTFEVGFKSRFERGALNFGLFDQSVENFQSTIFNGTAFVLSNAGEQSTQGFEFDGTFDVTDWLTLTAAGVIQDPVFDEFLGATVALGSEVDLADGLADGIGDLSGEQPAGINEISLSTSATFKYDFGNGINAYLRGDYQFEDDVQVVDGIEGINRSTNIFNGALGVNLDNGVGIRFWARNITDDRSFTSAFPGVLQNDVLNGGPGLGTVNVYPNEPRTYGVSLRYNFGAK